MDEAEIMEPVDSLTWEIVVAGLVLGALIALLAFVVARSIARPVIAARDAARDLAEGDLGVSARPRSDKDVLMRALGDMIARLREVVGGILSGAEQVASGSEELSATSASKDEQAPRRTHARHASNRRHLPDLRPGRGALRAGESAGQAA